MEVHRTESAFSGPVGRLRSIVQRAIDLLVCIILWCAALVAAQAVREVFVFVPGFVPLAGESPEGFFTFVGSASGLAVMAVLLATGAGSISARAAVRRLVDGVGLRPAGTVQQGLRWVTVGLAAAVVLAAVAELVVSLPGLTSVRAAEDPRYVALAQTPNLIRFRFGLIAPAPLEELLFRGPLLALWLALLASQSRGGWASRRWVRWSLMAPVIAASVLVFASLHTMGGSANVAHAAANGLITTAVTLWQRSLFPALTAHGLYDAYAFTWP
ncbi:CPBP family intramembrane glutamic endopeptidase [Streptomyces chartreusis]|uniref:CPBP family intramembrane glutamic endopeptidase n=1 Tax=Streptomyces chartreusis TaxID=1969 RepID=UPI0033D483A1